MKEKVIDIYPPSPHASRSKKKRTKNNNSLRGVFAFLLLLIAIGGGYFCYASYRTEIVIQPEVTEFAVKEDVVSRATGSLQENEVRGAVLVEKITEKTLVEVEGREIVESVAVVTVEVCQDYTASSNLYIEGTRFTSNDGLLFRANEKFTVLGTGQGGCVEIEVTADEAGEEYNLSEGTILHLPGLQGTVVYENVTGTSVNLVTEGSIEEVPYLREEEKIVTEENLKQEILEKGKKAIKEKYNEEYLIGYYEVEVIEKRIFEEGETSEKFNFEIDAEVRAFGIEYDFLDSFAKDFIPEGYTLDEESKQIESIFNNINFQEQSAEISLIFSAIIYNEIDKEGLKREVAGLNFQEAQTKIQESIDLKGFTIYNRPIGLLKKVSSADRIKIILDFNNK
ncbi:MAG: baseplate J/gp47 family protein [Patescibacteria group bacterium]|nr:baseplate J/gp47 family protein [Patescibacteria group bacterium]